MTQAHFAAAPARGQDAPAKIRTEDIIDRFDMDPDGDLLIVPVTLGRRSFPFILDTGTTLNAFDTQLKDYLGPVQEYIDIKTASGGETLKLYDPPRAFMGRFNLRTPQGVTCMDLNGVRRATGHEFYGIVGMTFMLDRVIHLNFDEGKLSFLRSDAPRLGTPVPIAMVKEMPRINVDFEGLGLRSLLCDTGSVGVGSGNLSTSDFNSLIKSGGVNLLGKGLSADLSRQQQPTRYGLVKRLKVGTEFHEGLIFSDHVTSDILGMGFWKRYNVTFDFPNHVVYLQKNQYDPSLDDSRVEPTGLHFKAKNGRVVVHGVDNGSPAAKAGVLAGDFLTAVDGKKAIEIPVRTLRREFRIKGKDLNLAFRRGMIDYDVRMKIPNPQAIGVESENLEQP
ncbi:PDZ domain-containing protein [Singulisphaera sp. PoT]|uniref:PDZ domain-containing protein n=1 Tax=Singulisphaera sp. PoT TaxID=3411797 RepID=UPI003BF5C754